MTTESLRTLFACNLQHRHSSAVERDCVQIQVFVMERKARLFRLANNIIILFPHGQLFLVGTL